MANRKRVITGKVIKRRVGGNSKSGRMAIVLSSKDDRLLLVRRGGNPLFDAELAKLVGKSMRFHGRLEDTVFTVTSWKEV